VLDIPLSHAALLTFHFVGLGFSTSRLRYRYRLSGWDKEWRETEAQHVRYEDLPRGEYHFEVYAINRDLVRSQSPAQVRVRLLPDSRENDITRFESQIAQFEQMLESEQRIALLNKVLVDLGTNSSLWEGDFDVALRHIAEVSARAIGVTRVGIWMVNSDETALDCWESFDARTGQHTSGDRLELSDHRGYYDALQHNRIIDATEAASDPRTSEFADNYLIPNQIHSLLDAPIRIEGRTVGVVCHEFAGERHEWGLEEKFFVVSIVDFIALAYERWHRKKTEEGLQHTHQIYRAAIESIRGIPYVVNLLEDRYEFFGEACEEILGISSEAITPQFFRDRTLEVTPSDPQETRASEEYIQDFLAGKMDRFRMDMRFKHPDGRVLWLTDAAIPIRNPETGKIESDLGIILDITDRKLAEERIERTQQDYHQAIQVAGAVPYRQSYLTNRYDFLGPEIEELTGYKAEEFSPEIWDSMIEEVVLLGDLEKFSVDDAVEVAKSREGISWRADFRVRTKDGSEKWISNSAIQIHDEEGKVVGSLGILQDITDRRNATSQLAQSEELYRTAIEVAGAVPYYQLYDSDTYQFMGEGIQEIVGCPPDEFNGFFEDHILEVVPRGELAGLSYLDAVMRCRSDGAVWKADYRIRRPDGSERWLSNSAVQVRDENGRVVASLGILQDITERIRAEEESRNLEAQIQQAQKLESLGVLAGGIAHDFNNLLMGILGNTSLARSEAGADPSLCEYLEQIELASQRAADLTNQMLAYSGRGKFIIRNFNLNDLVREMTSLLESSISKKATLTLNVAKDLPDVEGDATQIRQVVMNLITNASDSLEDRSGLINLTTGVIQADREYFANAYTPEDFQEGEYVFLEVRDTGCGMDRETQRRIFEPFFTTKFTGRGLGLSAILGIVRGHKGALSVYSEKGQGTTMKILLPTPERKRPSEDLLLHPGFDPNWRGTGTVLVVDDEITVRNVTKRMLAKAGLEALTAADGEEGLKVFLSNREAIRLVILDMTMPRMDGAEAFEQIRRIDTEVPVLLMSGYSEAEATQKFEAPGLSGYLQKPFGTSTLLGKIQSILKT
jgi:PAS domain S-box-containing protein